MLSMLYKQESMATNCPMLHFLFIHLFYSDDIAIYCKTVYDAIKFSFTAFSLQSTLKFHENFFRLCQLNQL